MKEINLITGAAVHAALRIHKKLGPGLLESVYKTILARDLAQKGLSVEREKWVSFDFEGLWFDNACRVDMLIEKAVVIEVKSVEAIAAVHEKQLQTYLRLLDCRAGLLLNFGPALMKDGIKRIVNGL